MDEKERGGGVATIAELTAALGGEFQRAMAPVEQKIAALEGELKAIKAPQGRVAELIDGAREAGNAERQQALGFAGAHGPRVEVGDNIPKGIRFARIIKGIGISKQTFRPLPEVLQAMYPDDTRLNRAVGDAHKKALAAGTLAAGGALVPEEFSAEVVEQLRALSTVRKMGARSAPMATIPKFTAGATAAYVGENTNITKTEPTFGQIIPVPRKLAAVVPVSNDLLRRATVAADQIVLRDAVASLASVEDLKFLRGLGVSNEPKGLMNQVNSANKFNANSTVNLANVTADLVKAIRLTLDADVKLTAPGWVFAPRTWGYLRQVQTTTGARAFPELDQGLLMGYPFAYTSQIPINLGGGSNESEVYFVNFDDVLICEEPGEQLIVDVSQEAAYHDGSNVIAAFSQDQTVIRVISIHDLVVRYDKALSLIQQAIWV